MLLNYAFKMSKVVNFMYIFTTIKKKMFVRKKGEKKKTSLNETKWLALVHMSAKQRGYLKPCLLDFRTQVILL